MQKRLTEEQQQKMIEVATREFGKHGFHAASINEIATGAGVSVGVIYKYYSDKKDLFDACLNSAVQYVDQLLNEILETGPAGMEPKEYLEYLIRFYQRMGRQEKDKLRMYHLITTNRAGFDDAMLASKLEASVADAYIKNLKDAPKRGLIRQDLDPSFIAMFLNDMLTNLLFAQCSPYYQARIDIYCGEDDGTRDEKLITQLAVFLCTAIQKQD